MSTGIVLPTFRREVTQGLIEAYAEVSGDRNPLHIDPAFAAAGPFGGTIAHGMLLFGYLSDLMGRAYGPAWAAGGRLRVRFRAPARPGDTLTVSGEARAAEETSPSAGSAQAAGRTTVRCALECRNAEGQVLASGEAWVTLSAAS